MSEISDIIERKILRVLEEAGDEGVVQRELWDIIGVDSRSGARIVARLEKMGLVERERIMYKGKATYILRVPKRVKEGVRIPAELREVPCFSCQYLDICGEGGSVNPERCIKLLRWLEKKAEEMYNGEG
ncbi:MAG: transcription factor TFIIIC [Thermoprotei archaeon]|nr:MAG: transcription factor TFIIIC [Thermoprotei archaeon]RLF03604.1 MAG: transcription factor TFIIIC [Thermoprotei archaeon]